MRYRAKIGDIAEIRISKGLVYVQLCYKHEKYGTLIRVLDGLFQSRPGDYRKLVLKNHKLLTLFPFGDAVNKQMLEVISNQTVPSEFAQFPLFRAAGYIDKRGVVKDWWLWDGEKQWRVGDLTPDQMELPQLEIPDYVALTLKIESAFKDSEYEQSIEPTETQIKTSTAEPEPIRKSHEQAVVIHLNATNLPQAVYDKYDLSTLEDKIIIDINKARSGEYDGNEFGNGEVKLYLYGRDAEKLFKTVEPILRDYPLAKQSFVIIRSGPPGAPERRVNL